jgi:hypothetical protein
VDLDPDLVWVGLALLGVKLFHRLYLKLTFEIYLYFRVESGDSGIDTVCRRYRSYCIFLLNFLNLKVYICGNVIF